MEECMSWKENCYIGDWSFLWVYKYSGPDVLKLFSDISINSFANFNIGQSKHVVHCNESGKVIHDGILSRLGEDEYVLFGRNGFYVNWYLDKHNYNVTVTLEDWYNLQVAGPNALSLLEEACCESLRDVKFMYNKRINIRGKSMWALRQGMSGEPGFELQGPITDKYELVDDLMEIGKKYDAHRLGARCAAINHLEACFPTIIVDYIPAFMDGDLLEYYNIFKASMPAHTTDIALAGSYEGDTISDYYRSPIELGWGKSIKFDHDFVGRKALEEELANPKRIIRTLVWNAEDVIDIYASMFKKNGHFDYIEFPRFQRGVMYADKVMKNGKFVGVTSSYGYSYYFREMLCLCVIDIEESEIGNDVSIIWGTPGRPQKEVRAKVAPAPYKQDRRKINLSST